MSSTMSSRRFDVLSATETSYRELGEVAKDISRRNLALFDLSY